MKSKYKVGQLVEYQVEGNHIYNKFGYITAVVLREKSVSYMTVEHDLILVEDIQNAFKVIGARKTKKVDKPAAKKKSSKKAENSTSL